MIALAKTKPLALLQAAVWSCFLCWLPASLWALDGRDARMLHAIIVADTLDPNIGELCDIDGRNVHALIHDEVPLIRRGPIHQITGKNVTQESILKTIQDLQVESNDSLFLYFSGHGAYVRDTGHVIKMTDDKLFLREELIKALKDKGARLTILVTDSCSNIIPKSMLAMAAREIPPKVLDYDACRYLFFRHAGVVDINAATPPQEAVTLQDSGGIFTDQFTNLLLSPNTRFSRTPVSWADLFKRLSQAVEEQYQMHWQEDPDFRALFPNQEKQTPEYYSLAKVDGYELPKVKLRLGIDCGNTDGTGVRINKVYPNSQAEWAGFQVGEILFAVEPEFGGGEKIPIRSTNDINRFFWGPDSLAVGVHTFLLKDPQTKTSRAVKSRIRSRSVR